MQRSSGCGVFLANLAIAAVALGLTQCSAPAETPAPPPTPARVAGLVPETSPSGAAPAIRASAPSEASPSEAAIINGAIQSSLNRQSQAVRQTATDKAAYDAWALAEKQRWTPAVESAAQKAMQAKYTATEKAIRSLLRAPFRASGHADRDAERQPAEVLAFFHVQPHSTVLEVDSGDGWYTELLAPLLAQNGHLTVCSMADDASPLAPGTAQAHRTRLLLERSTTLFAKVERKILTSWAKSEIATPASVDVVLATEEAHEWLSGVYTPYVLAAAYRALKPGGVLGLEQRRAPHGTSLRSAAEDKRLPEEWLIEQATTVGFKLDATWPASLRRQTSTRHDDRPPDDRMVLRFVKPQAAKPQL